MDATLKSIVIPFEGFGKLFDVKTKRNYKRTSELETFSNTSRFKLRRELKNVSRPCKLLLHFGSVPFIKRRSRLGNSFCSLRKFLLPSVLELFHNFVFRAQCKLWLNFTNEQASALQWQRLKASVRRKFSVLWSFSFLVKLASCLIWHSIEWAQGCMSRRLFKLIFERTCGLATWTAVHSKIFK